MNFKEEISHVKSFITTEIIILYICYVELKLDINSSGSKKIKRISIYVILNNNSSCFL